MAEAGKSLKRLKMDLKWNFRSEPNRRTNQLSLLNQS